MNRYSDKEIISNKLSNETAGLLAEFFQSFSDASRLKIISVLTQAEMNVGSLAAEVGLSESATSHQLRGLRKMRLVRARKKGRQVFYGLDDAHVKKLFEAGLEHILHR